MKKILFSLLLTINLVKAMENQNLLDKNAQYTSATYKKVVLDSIEASKNIREDGKQLLRDAVDLFGTKGVVPNGARRANGEIFSYGNYNALKNLLVKTGLTAAQLQSRGTVWNNSNGHTQFDLNYALKGIISVNAYLFKEVVLNYEISDENGFNEEKIAFQKKFEAGNFEQPLVFTKESTWNQGTITETVTILPLNQY